jgi:MFS family permease
MSPQETSPVIVHAIQLAIAPVFLLTGIGAMLGVMANRLARIIDRARALDQLWAELDETARAAGRKELSCLERRRHLASWAINFCTGAALLVCLVIVTLFVEGIFGKDLKWLAAALFIGAMIALICGLTIFLREVYLATHAGRFETRRITR